MFIRIGRISRFLPRVRGLNAALVIYRQILPVGKTYRVENFDDDLIVDVDLREGIGVNIWHNPRGYERMEREFFLSAIKEGCNVLDVGANIGMYTLLAAKRGARVFAIEADPRNAINLRRHIELNGFKGTTEVFEMAASDAASKLTLHRSSSNSGASSIYGVGESFTVDARTIDSLNLPAIDVCKMDIEGAELPALLGMQATLARSPNLRLLIECSSEHRESRDLVAFLRGNFRKIVVVGGADLTGAPPVFCNLWCTK